MQSSDGEETKELLEHVHALSAWLEGVPAIERVEWASAQFGEHLVLSSSFGAQSAVCLHMATTVNPSIPVILIDTGYLFPETYRFIDELADRLRLNLHVYRSSKGPAWQEATYGRLWEQGLDGLNRYNYINKVEPMARALDGLDAKGWISGLRRQQAKSRVDLGVLLARKGRIKIHPIIEWNDYDVYQYLQRFDLPYHPLWEKGYVSIGDVHTTSRLLDGMTEEETRFFGLKRECGIHELI
ncbi:phosphoadenylyl-sulfate reductase [Plasticicumulans acidivorans]|uniref:Phosphoadenosine 5'-phosphosulfate reductase n=1 Tax=Plasticicumulans acidivorans TaxID=886464 RepID=A0A317MV02_9GAMM|nr:phosphoadenylyl-sulfate reductase [Plasticicumulans acidivorans]PWV61748.1 phosphoadenylylsulfate reductase (thioredoxin) [Plasticicumulans acidivorans]